MRLQQKAEKLSTQVFLGGPPHLFETAGRMQLILLLKEGLYPHSKVLDIGCGCLRGGYWLIHFLRPGCYLGLEPNRKMVEIGVREFLEPGLVKAKRPRFAHNANFDFSVFGEKIDFFVARSIWTHASKRQIRTMLDEYEHHRSEAGVFFASYLRAALPEDDYQGDDWVGRSHQSGVPGMVRHSFDWIEGECHRRGLVVEEIRQRAYNFGGQIWLKVMRR